MKTFGRAVTDPGGILQLGEPYEVASRCGQIFILLPSRTHCVWVYPGTEGKALPKDWELSAAGGQRPQGGHLLNPVHADVFKLLKQLVTASGHDIGFTCGKIGLESLSKQFRGLIWSCFLADNCDVIQYTPRLGNYSVLWSQLLFYFFILS